ncbi:hypothetical protein [Halocatena marina]|uniref:hypothetical protein n=1 Tax=Halocatena marina TaxID=2934937 RepID=UPI00200ECD6B|nr:hypothetical protein [Halocatena marina]
MTEFSSASIDDDLPPGTRRVIAVDPIEGEEGMIDLTAVFRPFKPTADRLDFHTFSFRYVATATDEYLLGLNEWLPPERAVSAWQVGMLKYISAYFAHYDVQASVTVPVHEYGDFAEGPPVDRFEQDAELHIGRQ